LFCIKLPFLFQIPKCYSFVMCAFCGHLTVIRSYSPLGQFSCGTSCSAQVSIL
jgi:hypothetical protein